MNAPVAGMGKESRGQFLLWSLAALAVALFAINSTSFWIDEALTGLKARQPDLASWWRLMVEEKGSDLQMPLYMAYIWGFARIFGTTEWALRAANIPWFVCGVVAFIHAFPEQRRRLAAIVALASPFAWYYLNEARPYAMQFGAGLMVFAALYRLCTDGAQAGPSEWKWIWIYLVGIIALMGSSLLGMIFAAAALVCLPISLHRDRLRQLFSSHVLACAVGAVIFLSAAGYYLWTLNVGARASPVGSTDFRNVGLIGYELLGFGGLGPGRLEIREGGLASFAPFILSLGLYAIVVLAILCTGIAGSLRETSSTKAATLLTIVAAPAVILLGAGFALHFRVLARHLTPLLAPILFLFVIGFSAHWAKPSWMGRLITGGFLLLSIISCLELRFAARHEKDDYRRAAALAASALTDHRTVWWNASREGAEYYGLQLARDPAESGHAFLVFNLAHSSLAGLPDPDIVITSKPDVFDGFGGVSAYLREKSYSQSPAECRAFSVWERKK